MFQSSPEAIKGARCGRVHQIAMRYGGGFLLCHGLLWLTLNRTKLGGSHAIQMHHHLSNFAWPGGF
jgi:hypothetical protein